LLTRPSILFLVHRVPFPPDKGDRIRSFQLLKYLGERAAVDLACLADEPVVDHVRAALQRYCRHVAIEPVGAVRWLRGLASLSLGRSVTEGAFRSPALARTIAGWAATNRYHAAVAYASSMVPYLRIKALAGVPALVDLVDVDSQKWLDYAAKKRWPKSWLYRLEARRLRKLERGLPSWTRAVTLVSEPEAEIYRSFAAPGHIAAILNGVDLDYFQNDESEPAGRETCVFVGALDYYPNVDAVSWFCREVWPRVRQARPHARFLLVGRRPVPAVKQLATQAGVEVIADVPDVRPYLKAAEVAVIPLRIARGLQNKVLEALAMKKAVIAAPPALVALQARPGEHLLAASSPAEWADAVNQLFADRALRQRLGEAGRRYVEENHRWQTCLEPLSRILGLDQAPCGPRQLLVQHE
jgi:sugar transferase (PEP-CTERM/EpsH1 system associated)